jgi:hypothetical protein
VIEDDNNTNNVSNDWHEEGLQFAIGQSWYVGLTKFKSSYWMLHSISKTTVGTVKGSKGMRSKTDEIDDLLTYGGSRNVDEVQ